MGEGDQHERVSVCPFIARSPFTDYSCSDPSAHELYLTLFRQASAPYAEMLQRWITTGQLKDPHQEFMVRESKDITRQILDRDHTDDYWERRYVVRYSSNFRGFPSLILLLLQLRDGTTVKGSDRQVGVPRPRTEGGRLPGGACIPPLLDAWKKKILLAGKYLNVIRECGIDIQQPTPKSDSDGDGKGKKRTTGEKDEEPQSKDEETKSKEKTKEEDETKSKEKNKEDDEPKSKQKNERNEVFPLDDERYSIKFVSTMQSSCLYSRNRFYQAIEDAYSFANRTLLRLLVKDQDLVPRLRYGCWHISSRNHSKDPLSLGPSNTTSSYHIPLTSAGSSRLLGPSSLSKRNTRRSANCSPYSNLPWPVPPDLTTSPSEQT